MIMGHKPLWKPSLSVREWKKTTHTQIERDKPLCARPMNQFSKRSNFSSTTTARFNGPLFIPLGRGRLYNTYYTHLSRINYTWWEKFKSFKVTRVAKAMPLIFRKLKIWRKKVTWNVAAKKNVPFKLMGISRSIYSRKLLAEYRNWLHLIYEIWFHMDGNEHTK